MTTIRCTFWGRLDQGKWADLMIDCLPQFLSQNNLHDWEFHIFGSGYYEDQLQILSQQYSQLIIHWRSSRDQIKTVAQSWQYCLCPSTFLETFGMSALEGCKLWLPVIWPDKWWLQQFSIQNLIWLWESWENNSQWLLMQLCYLDVRHDELYEGRKNETLNIGSQYGSSIRLNTINKLII